MRIEGGPRPSRRFHGQTPVKAPQDEDLCWPVKAPQDEDRIYFAGNSHGHRGFDVRVGLIILEREILIMKTENIGHRRIQFHDRQSKWTAGELLTRLIQMIGIEVSIAERMDELTGLEAGHLRDHHG